MDHVRPFISVLPWLVSFAALAWRDVAAVKARRVHLSPHLPHAPTEAQLDALLGEPGVQPK